MQADLRTRVSLLNPIHFLGLGFGSGLIPLMPGTMGSLAALPLLMLMSYTSDNVFLVITLIAVAIGIVICGKTARALGVHDHGAIVGMRSQVC
jgi:phosphatidylglycerophosphatase A